MRKQHYNMRDALLKVSPSTTTPAGSKQLAGHTERSQVQVCWGGHPAASGWLWSFSAW